MRLSHRRTEEAEQYNPEIVGRVLRLKDAPPERVFYSYEEMMRWLDEPEPTPPAAAGEGSK